MRVEMENRFRDWWTYKYGKTRPETMHINWSIMVGWDSLPDDELEQDGEAVTLMAKWDGINYNPAFTAGGAEQLWAALNMADQPLVRLGYEPIALAFDWSRELMVATFTKVRRSVQVG